ncbi:CapA family protein [Aneurinibacillus aneurinilyticus]|nr:CapA family protein [Aneurinibacillus aneurinilyticus]MCI1695734.1 CapA family protein [Aneurinibacillus aneurinilyticus]MED0706708.1 CapA family protein [Aneurinibacillus aneurinilyticus]MED0722582.1 CapA family protein [Aneurinibacillus aneurinilyticus]MED0734244.1 CapA family protein [Aneurinibacillus aneurinilyticus]MED0742616.1 CapA family protein [Aneurinibacillus aneurinilyticus]
MNRLQLLCVQIILSISLCGAVTCAMLLSYKKDNEAEAAKPSGKTREAYSALPKSDKVESEQKPNTLLPENNSLSEEAKTITVSAAGDVTIGTDESFPYPNSFNHELKKNGHLFFPQNVKDIFNQDDLTIVNLETTLTEAKVKAAKQFRFKGAPENAQILRMGSIEAVNIANNHIHDYLQRGYEDTINNLKKHNIGFFGYEHTYMTNIKGVKVGALGYEGWDNTVALRTRIDNDIAQLRAKGTQIVIVSFHWGVERSNYPNATQMALGRHAIDSGADLVLGHHPHVIQGIEEYKGKYIVYSLGNFIFGGNRNPTDKDTFIFQQTFHIKNGKITEKKECKVIPTSISSVKERNNYQPTPLRGQEAERVLSRLKKYSEHLQIDWNFIQQSL